MIGIVYTLLQNLLVQYFPTLKLFICGPEVSSWLILHADKDSRL